MEPAYIKEMWGPQMGNWEQGKEMGKHFVFWAEKRAIWAKVLIWRRGGGSVGGWLAGYTFGTGDGTRLECLLGFLSMRRQLHMGSIWCHQC